MKQVMNYHKDNGIRRTDPMIVQGFFFKIGASVNENEPFGNVVFDSGDTYIYGTKFELHPGTTVNEGASVDFIINKTPWNYLIISAKRYHRSA